MFSLLLAIASSSSIALLFKVSERGDFNRYRVTSANYFTAFMTSLVLFLIQTKTLTDSLMISKVKWSVVLGLGIPAGLFFFLSFVIYQKSVKENGASLSAMFGKLGILLPMLASILVWQELPSLKQGIGILIAFSAMIYVNLAPGLASTAKKTTLNLTLLFLFLAGGMAEFSSKLFQKLGQSSDQNLFLFIVFFTAFCLSLSLSLKSEAAHKTSLKYDLLMGIAVGVPNLLSSAFLISALRSVPAAIAFPIYSSGSIAVIATLSYWLFGEKMTKASLLGIGLTMIALTLVF